jgi:hypothetical protein
MVCMVPPHEPRIRPLGHDASLVSHPPYDGTLTDSFQGTSLHLSFTTWKVPLDWDSTGDMTRRSSSSNPSCLSKTRGGG